MKVLITGAAGQVGAALKHMTPAQAQIRCTTRDQLDISDAAAVERAVCAYRPDVIINAAAYTAVDRAEDEPQIATAINVEGAANLARSAQGIAGCRLLHISTDYVFDGRSSRPYRPDDAPNPLCVYGRSKLQAERSVLQLLENRCVVLRTAWVYAAQGKNFMLTMLRLMRERGAVRVVADQRGTPTCAASVARALWGLAARQDLHGILHWTDAGADSWHGFATAIAEEAHAAGILPTLPSVTPISTAEYPTRAHRPANSELDSTASIALLGIIPIPWRVNLRSTLTSVAAY